MMKLLHTLLFSLIISYFLTLTVCQNFEYVTYGTSNVKHFGYHNRFNGISVWSSSDIFNACVIRIDNVVVYENYETSNKCYFYDLDKKYDYDTFYKVEVHATFPLDSIVTVMVYYDDLDKSNNTTVYAVILCVSTCIYLMTYFVTKNSIKIKQS